MKKHFTLLSLFVFCLFFSFTLLGQEKIKIDESKVEKSKNQEKEEINAIPIIKIALSGNESGKLSKLKVTKGSPVIIKFIGINPLKYTYALNHQFVNQFSENSFVLPSSFKRTDQDSSATIDSKIVKIENQIKANNNEIETRKNTSLKADQSQKLIYEKEIKTLEDEVTSLESQLKNLKEQKLRFFKELFLKYQLEVDILNIKSTEGEKSDLENSRSAYELILQRSESIKTNIENEIDRARSQDILNLESLRATIGKYHSISEQNLKSYKDMIENYPYPEDVPIYKTKEGIENNFKEIKKKVDLVNSLQDSIQTPPLDYHGENLDFIKVSLEIVPIDEKAKPVNQIKNYDYKVWIKGGWKIDFSAGIFLSSLRDRSFLTIKQESTENEGDNLYKIIKEDQGKYEFGIGSTVNFNFRNASFTSFGGSVGGYVTSDQKFRLIAGPTLILGKMERIIFSFGVVMGEITALSNKVNLNDTFDLGSDGTVPTVQKFDFGRYFSFTYNLGKAKGKEE